MWIATRMCGACSVPFGPGHAAGLDGVEREATRQVALDPAKPLERRVGPARIARMRVAALPVSLPDLEQDAVDRRPLAVEHPAFDADALADGVRRDEIAVDQLLPG